MMTKGDGVKAASPLLTSQMAAPLFSRAVARAMEPPYMRIIPQLTYSSILSQETTRKANRAAVARIAMFASPSCRPKIIQPPMVRTTMTAVISSLADVFPISSRLRLRNCRPWSTSSISIGKKRSSSQKPMMRSGTTIMIAARVQAAKEKSRPVLSRSMPTASGALAPPRKVAMPPMMHPQAMAMKRRRA